MSPKFQSSTFGETIMHSAARSLCDSCRASCFTLIWKYCKCSRPNVWRPIASSPLSANYRFWYCLMCSKYFCLFAKINKTHRKRHVHSGALVHVTKITLIVNRRLPTVQSKSLSHHYKACAKRRLHEIKEACMTALRNVG